MFRFAVLLATTLAVAHTQTLLYPSNFRQISWPLQTQFPLTHHSLLNQQLQFVPLNPVSTIYKFPASTRYQLHFVPLHQRQLIQPTTITHTRTLPLLWSQTGRSFGSEVPAAPVAHSGLVSGQQSVVGQQGVHLQSTGIVGVQGGQQFQQTHGQSQVVGYVPGGAIVATPVVDHQGSHISHPGQLPLTAGHGISPVPVSYSTDLPKTQPLASTGHISQLPASQGAILGQTVGHQESVGHHQVSQVTLPGQIGVGGGYTSAAFYESAPSTAGVVIPSVPLSPEPIVASDVKVASKSGQSIVEPVQNVQSHGGQHHHTIGTVGIQAY